MLIWVGAVIVVVCAVGFAALLGHAGKKTAVLALARPVPAGDVLELGDLREVQLGVDDAAGHVVPAAEARSVVGRTAVVPLTAGALLAPEQLGTQAAYPPAGRAQVSVAAEPGGVPAGLAPGQRVAVLPGGSAEAATGAGEESTARSEPSPVVGVVTDVSAPEDGGAAPTVVTLLVDTAAVRRAVAIDKPRLVVLSPVGREVP